MVIKSKKLIFQSFFFFVIALTLTFFISKDEIVTASSSAGILPWLPIYLDGKWNIIGIIGVIILILSMNRLVYGLNQWKKRLVVLALLSFVVLPFALTGAYQTIFAKGINAVSYDGNGVCELHYGDKNVLDGDCEFVLENKSNKEVTFEVEFIDTNHFYDDVADVSLMNEGGPYTFTLKPKEEKKLHIQETIQLTETPSYSDTIHVDIYRIKLIDGDKTRTLYKMN